MPAAGTIREFLRSHVRGKGKGKEGERERESAYLPGRQYARKDALAVETLIEIHTCSEKFSGQGKTLLAVIGWGVAKHAAALSLGGLEKFSSSLSSSSSLFFVVHPTNILFYAQRASQTTNRIPAITCFLSERLIVADAIDCLVVLSSFVPYACN